MHANIHEALISAIGESHRRRVAERPERPERTGPASEAEEESILIVGCDLAAIQQVRTALAGHRDVRIATNGSSATRQLEERTPDLIFVDGEMPGESSFELSARLHRDPAFRGIPVILLTARADPAFELRALESGASDVLTKPIHGPLVALRARLHLRLRRQRAELERLAVTDELTGLGNRRAFDEALEREWAGAVRAARPLSLVLVGVDQYARFEHVPSRAAKGRCLRQVARTVRSVARRRTDLTARVGAGELALLLPDTPSAGARVVGELLSEAVRDLRLPRPGSTLGAHVTVSVGICTRPSDAEPAHGSGCRALLEGAEHALDRATGRRHPRVVVAPLPSATD